ncbi:MAG: hypothetical protein ACTSPI_00675 [Candidatus Heimdallarchaeaceae archaeon]
MLRKIARKIKELANRVLDIHAIEIQGILSAKLIKKDGSTKDFGVIATKKVTTEFVNFLVDCMQSSDTKFADFKYHISGTGTNAESNADTQLQTPIGTTREVGTQTEGASANIYKSVATITYSGSYAVTEHAIFNEQYSAAQDDGILLDRSIFSAINVDNGDSIEFTYELEVKSET